jgi:hypothetical protein
MAAARLAAACEKSLFMGFRLYRVLFLLWQSRHVTIALQLFFARIFTAIPSYKRPE